MTVRSFITSGARRLRGRVGRTAIVAWFSVMALCSAGLLARHVLAMPVPGKTTQLGHQLMALRAPDARPSWLAVHILGSECPCSQRIVSHLVETTRPAEWAEIVLWVGTVDPPRDLTQRFDVRRVTAAELASYEIEAVPLLVAIAATGEVRYAGGYTDRKQGPVIRDLEVLSMSRGSTDVSSLPLFGCATSERLRRLLAPLPFAVRTP